MSARGSCALHEAPQTFNGAHAGPLQRLPPAPAPGQGSDLARLQPGRGGRAVPRALSVHREPPGPERHRGGAARGCPRRAPPSESRRRRRRLRGGGGSRQAGSPRSCPARAAPPGDPPAGSGAVPRPGSARAAPQTTTPGGQSAAGRRRGGGAGGRARRAAIGRGGGGRGAHGDGRKERGQMAERWSRGPSRARR